MVEATADTVSGTAPMVTGMADTALVTAATDTALATAVTATPRGDTVTGSTDGGTDSDSDSGIRTGRMRHTAPITMDGVTGADGVIGLSDILITGVPGGLVSPATAAGRIRRRSSHRTTRHRFTISFWPGRALTRPRTRSRKDGLRKIGKKRRLH